jgi:hypothetical protein
MHSDLFIISHDSTGVALTTELSKPETPYTHARTHTHTHARTHTHTPFFPFSFSFPVSATPSPLAPTLSLSHSLSLSLSPPCRSLFFVFNETCPFSSRSAPTWRNSMADFIEIVRLRVSPRFNLPPSPSAAPTFFTYSSLYLLSFFP